MSGSPGELRALTGVQALAAWYVVFYHLRLSIAGLPPLPEKLMAKGYLAVDFFFLLSGFVIWLGWHTRLRDPGAIPRFLLKRIARIWPLHFVMLATAVALTGLLIATGHAPRDSAPWRELPLHLVLAQNWGFTDRLAFNDPSWSISTEFAAYLLFPVLVVAVDWRCWPRPALIVAAVVPIAILAVILRAEDEVGAAIARYGLIRCLTEFTSGTVVAALWLRGGRATPPLIAAGVLFAAWMAGFPEPLAMPLCLAAVLLALARSAGRPHHPLEGRAIRYLGEISYATYLVHMVFWRIFKLVFVTDPAAVPPMLIALYCTTVLALSALLYEYIERPAQRWLTALPTRTRRARVGKLYLMPARRRVPPPAPR